MGTIVIHKEVPKNDPQKALIDDFLSFKKWYAEYAHEASEWINYDLLEFMDNLKDHGELFDSIEPRLADEMFFEYLGTYCDFGPGRLNSVDGIAELPYSRYVNDTDHVNDHCDENCKRLWSFILTGRSLDMNSALNNKREGFHYCVFSETECQHLTKEFLKILDSIQFKDKPQQFQSIKCLTDAIKNKRNNGLLVIVTS